VLTNGYLQKESCAVSLQAFVLSHLSSKHSAAPHEPVPVVHVQHVGRQSLAEPHVAPAEFVPVTMVGAVGHAPLLCSARWVLVPPLLLLLQPTTIDNAKPNDNDQPFFIVTLSVF
jgi:hypothetical protein